MTPQSKKAKGRRLQQHIRDKILEVFPEFQKDDVKSTSMGAPGEDVQLSPFARTFLPFYIEAKNRARFAIYSIFDAIPSSPYHPLLVIRENNNKPLAVLDLDVLLDLIRECHDRQVS